MRNLAPPNPAFEGDLGDADPGVRQAVASADDQEGYLRAIAALCTTRLLMPIVASGDESMDGPDPTRHAEMAAVSIRNDAGEGALLAFTGLDALQAWQSDARPVPCLLDDLAATVVETGDDVLLLDVAGPTPFVVGHDLIVELARGRRLVHLPDGGFGWMFRDTGPETPRRQIGGSRVAP